MASYGQQRINANDKVSFFAIESKRRQGGLVYVPCSLNNSKNPPLHLLPLAYQLLSADIHTVANTGGLTSDLFSVTRKGGGGFPPISLKTLMGGYSKKIRASTQNMVFLPELSR
jgi:hypothetical protein